MDDRFQLPQISPNSLPPLLDETPSSYYEPSMEGLIPQGASSSIQGQDMMTIPMNYYNQFLLTENNNLPMMHYLSGLTQQNTSNQLLVPNIQSNQIFNGVNEQSSSYPAFFQQNPHMEAGVGNETTNGHFMANQSSPVFTLNNHAINPTSAWSMQDQGNDNNALLENNVFQLHSSTLNGPKTPLSADSTTSTALNSAILGYTEGSSPQVFNTQAPQTTSLLGSERASGVGMQQVAPFSANSFTPQRADNGFPLSSNFRAHHSVSSLNMLNQNDRSTFTSNDPYSTLQQNSSLNSQYQRQGQREPPRRGRPRKHFEPTVACSFKRRKRGSSAQENSGKTSLSQRNQSPDGVATDDQNSTSPSFAATTSPLMNAMYDPAFERAGVPIDPLLRLFNITSDKHAGPATTQS